MRQSAGFLFLFLPTHIFSPVITWEEVWYRAQSEHLGSEENWVLVRAVAFISCVFCSFRFTSVSLGFLISVTEVMQCPSV